MPKRVPAHLLHDMKPAVRKPPGRPVTRRDQLLGERDRSQRLSRAYPDIEQLHIELMFSETGVRAPAPSSQLHILHGAAAAFFRFPCPCADCDGDFDLATEIGTLLENGRGARRTATRAGHMGCRGTRFRNHSTLQSACPTQLKFSLRSEPLVDG